MRNFGCVWFKSCSMLAGWGIKSVIKVDTAIYFVSKPMYINAYLNLVTFWLHNYSRIQKSSKCKNDIAYPQLVESFRVSGETLCDPPVFPMIPFILCVSLCFLNLWAYVNCSEMVRLLPACRMRPLLLFCLLSFCLFVFFLHMSIKKLDVLTPKMRQDEGKKSLSA